MTIEEPEWTLTDLRAALDWQAEQNLICSGCGHYRDETMVHEEDAPFYDVVSLACHACAARDRVARDAADTQGAAPPGRYYSVTARQMPRQQSVPPRDSQ